MKRITRRGTTAVGFTLLALALAGCGGGGGGSSGRSTSGTGTTSTTSNGAALLAAYTPPADIVADVQTNYTGPAFSTYNSGLASNCENPSKVSSTVIVTPNALVFSAGASLKAQELAADLLEQAIPQIRADFGLPSSGVAFDGTNRISLCVDPTMGQSAGETGTGVTGQTGTGVGPVMQVMAADSPSFDQRYPGATSYSAPVGQSYADLFVHETTHAAVYSLTEPFLGPETFFQEGLATTLSHLPLGSKGSILAAVQASDLLSTSNANSDMNAYPVYEATMTYVTSTAAGGLGYGMTNIPAFLATFKTKAETACAQAIPNGLTPTAAQTVGLPTGQYNTCMGAPGVIDSRLTAAFDSAWNATFKDSGGATPLYLHTADSADSLESTLYQRLSGFLQ